MKTRMAAFQKLDWQRIDVTAIVTYGGLATLKERDHAACRAWLQREGYTLSTLDCRAGLSAAVQELGELFRWEKQFGYRLGPESRNLDALRDGFEFHLPPGGGHVLELLQPEGLWEEDPRWFLGLLAIAQEHCRTHLALGRRFFVLLVVAEPSPLAGAPLEEARIPAPYWNWPHPFPGSGN